MSVIERRPAVGTLLREWRQRRHLSQLDLAVGAEVSTRHLSFVETGRSKPSRELVLHLAEHLDVPLRERNDLLVAAGYAPVYRRTALDAADMAPVREAVERILTGHEPFPALVVDRHWELLSANGPALAVLTDGVDAALLAPPVNVLRVSLHPDGLAPRIVNLADWAGHVLARLRREQLRSADPALGALRDELAGYVPATTTESAPAPPGLFVPLQLRPSTGNGPVLSFLSTVSTFGTALDVTLEELSIESFFPADEATAAALGVRPG